MDITKANKPIHIRCPYCKRDLQYNGASIKSQKEGLLQRINVINAKIKDEKDPQRKKELKKKLNDTKFKLKLLSEDIHMLSQLSETETLKIFKRKSKKYLGEELYLRLVKESEEQYLEDNTFNYYDLARQNFTNFNGV